MYMLIHSVMEFGVFDSCVQGHHFSTKHRPARRENPSNLYVMAAKNDAGTIVGHIPRTISAVCSLFYHRGGTIVCEVTGSR